jgi:hypothetical protein
VPVIRRHIGQYVQSNGKLEVPRVEIYQVIGPPGRDVVQQFLGQITVGVNDAYAVPKSDVLDDQVPQERSLAGTCFADDVYVLALVRGGYAETLGIAPALALPDDDTRLVVHGPKISRHSCHREAPVFDFRWCLVLSSAGKVFWDTPAR